MPTFGSLKPKENGTYFAEDGTAYSYIDATDVYQGLSADVIANKRASVTQPVTINANTIKAYSFYKFTKIPSVIILNATSIGSNAFTGCTSLQSVIANSVTNLVDNAFNGCTSLEETSFPNVTRLAASVFKGCTALKSISLPSLTNLQLYNNDGVDGFRDCANLESVSLPKLRYIYSQNLFYNTKLQYLVLPVMGKPLYSGPNNCRMGGNMFYQCPEFKALDLYTMYNFNETNCFYGDTLFDTLIIRNLSYDTNTVPSLTSVNVFANSPFASEGTGGTLYVPSRYISRYQSATNWSTIIGYENNQILPIEGSYYETHYADGTIIPDPPVYTEIEYTKANGRNYDSTGGYGGNSAYYGSDYVASVGNKEWQILSASKYNGNNTNIQMFNGNVCIGLLDKTKGFMERRVVDDTDYYALTFTLPDECSSFRFSSTSNTYKLYTVTKEA